MDRLEISFGVGVLIGSLVMGIGWWTHGDQYRQGQVDALTGKVKYELVVKDDSTRVWQEIERSQSND